MKEIFFTVTNDLSFDQRMHRICGSLSGAGFRVTLVGRLLENSVKLENRNYRQVRLKCIFNRGFAFYAEYNLRLFFFLLTKKMDGICAIDLDTILPCLFISKIRKKKRIYDAHEYFTELKEVRSRPVVKKIWTAIEKIAVPRFSSGYTVSQGLADAFLEKYHRSYMVIRNMPATTALPVTEKAGKYLYYQGAVNEGRGFEFLIPALSEMPYKLVVCGDGNFMDQLKQLIQQYGVQEKTELKGMMPPREMLPLAAAASLGMGLAEKDGLNQFHALPNKFFDYIHAGLPQVAMNYPEYVKINNEYKVAVLLNDLDPATISGTINSLMENEHLLQEMKQNCIEARKVFCWEREEKKLLDFYKELFA